MAVHSFSICNGACHTVLTCFVYFHYAFALTSSVYQLDSEYSGANFFQGWDFYTGGDPTGGFVTYYSQGSAQLTGMINASDSFPIYIGSDYNTVIGSTQAAGRPSVRISTQRSWTHGLFIGDFNHAPGGVCGSWPAFWTLGPNWPYNGEIDIMEGANLVTYNAATLHTNPNCTIAGDSRTMTGQLNNNNCAYYPGYNVGCGIRDTRSISYGAGFNAIGGGVYAMQWTSDYISVWFFPKGSIPSDIVNKAPNPSSWGLPMANMQGSCVIDQHFQAHKIILNNAFCGEYAGATTVWNSTTNSCATYTGYSTCNAYVAAQPAVFQQSYWSINSIRVYQLVDPSANASSTSTAYVASNQPTQSSTSTIPSPTPVPTTSLCPTYNFTVVQSGNFKYEIECGVNIGGSDIGRPYPSYQVTSFEDCVAGCSYWNTYNSSNICGGVTYQVSNKACYWKRNVGSTPADPNFNSARLMYYAYPLVTDDPRQQTSSSSSSTSYVATSVTPQDTNVELYGRCSPGWEHDRRYFIHHVDCFDDNSDNDGQQLPHYVDVDGKPDFVNHFFKLGAAYGAHKQYNASFIARFIDFKPVDGASHEFAPFFFLFRSSNIRKNYYGAINKWTDFPFELSVVKLVIPASKTNYGR
ncbi:uncharacterized protein Z519_01310 [Cladophialophora bantiana CBS 173.52]|uniref:endo-1,3(4)-beta-glucanase n=1 Tax=Cladophialophora bantiana (strain ATCC 10958 / CBS 173.52 / CDC B-1940 / NIH 8579) TaxID=1442370 RepID=A0A0D2F6A1_CLAB1|nr:uncharacterized protein Z519_01310 [Cladophialophora bantiana CBS 173.52]KIW97726.1 hypothetical protein Z519_01310 [Cladophialophora bantiana CBS 173.52]